MSVFEHRTAHISITHDGADAGKRDIQAARFGKLRREEAELHLAGVARLGMKCNGKDSSLRRMRFKIEMQQLDPELLVSRLAVRVGRYGYVIRRLQAIA